MATLLNRRRYMGGGGGYPADAIMTIETNPEVLAICYAQGWCANDKYMTASEAAAVTSIGTVFYNNKNILHFEEFEYFTGVTSVPANGFRGCTNLLTLTIPVNVTSIGNDAIGDNGIKRLVVKATNTTWGNAYTFTNNVIEYFYSNSQNTTISIFGTASGYRSAFIYLTTLELGPNVRSVQGFDAAANLTTVNISEGVTEFKDNCFRYCTSLVSVTLPSTTSVMTHGVFNNCGANLTSVTILATTPPTGISQYTFQNDTNVTIYVPTDSVSAYKSSWARYASFIQAIPTT